MALIVERLNRSKTRRTEMKAVTKITATTESEFKAQFKKLLTDPACSIENVVYRYVTEREISRSFGSSNILYVGQTKHSFNNRYSNSKSFKIEVLYFKSYKRYIAEYGPISIEIEKVDNSKRAEYQILESYRLEHEDLPPLNRSHGSANA